MGFPAKISTKDLARLLGISVQRVNQLAAENVLSKTARDQFDAAKSVKAFIAFRENAASSEAGRHHGLSKERSGLVRVQRQAAELELAERRGQLVEIDAATEIIGRCLLVVKNKMLGLGSKVAPLIAPASPRVAEQIIYDQTCEILTELSELETYGQPQPPAPVLS